MLMEYRASSLCLHTYIIFLLYKKINAHKQPHPACSPNRTIVLTLHIDPGCTGDDRLTALRLARLTFIGGVILQLGPFNLKMILPWNRNGDSDYFQNDTLSHDSLTNNYNKEGCIYFYCSHSTERSAVLFRAVVFISISASRAPSASFVLI